MKNVGIVTTWFERGAAYVSKQYENVIKNDFNTFIYARGGEAYAIGSQEWNNENVTWAKKIPLPTAMAIDKKDFVKWIDKNKIEIIIFNEQQWWPPILWAKEKGVICIAYIDYYTEKTIPFFEIYDILFCNTKRHFDTFSWHKGAFYIPWGTDTKLYKATNQLKLIDENKVIFFHSAGVSPERKGTQELLEAFNGTIGNSKLIIHSQVDLQNKLPQCVNIITKLIEIKRLEIVQETISAPGLYYLGDVYVYPSRLDGIGLTIAEALSSGLPIIVPNNQPMNEFVDETTGSKTVQVETYFSRDDGYYWPQCKVSIKDLQDKLQFFIDNKNNINDYKVLTRKHAEEKLEWAKNEKSIVSILRQAEYTIINKQNEQSILKYENEKNRFNIFFIIYNKFPFLFNIMKYLYNVFYK
jgi:glycosyltransferase involved in cell wall biosynthesis